jgi:transcriptional regulator with XRE-family HTH domain
MVEPTHFGDVLKEMRLSFDITQEAMAEMLEMSSKSYGRIERGEKRLTPERFYRYNKVFSHELRKRTGYILDERYSAKDILRKVSKIFEHLFIGGK